MQQKIKGIWDKVTQRWKGLSKKIKGLLAALLVLVLVGGVLLVVFTGTDSTYTTLFTGLTQDDLSGIVTYLSESGVTDYRIENNDTILVPAAQENQLRGELLVAGYPSSGFAYPTYLDNVGSLTTESERNQLVLYELQDRMASTIRTFDSVRDAVVNITPSQDNTYVLDSSNVLEAKASVTVTMEDDAILSDSEVSAIRNLLSHSVQGLTIDNVVIQDTMGNDYSGEDSLANIQDMSELKLALEQRTNNQLRTRVMQVLIPLYGEENVRVSVNSIVDVDRTFTDTVDYIPEADGETIIGQRIYDRQAVQLDEDGVAGGVVGTETNADLNTYVEQQIDQADGMENLYSASGEDNYLVDTQNRQVEHLAGTVVDVSVAVTINQDVAGSVDMASLYPHVARAAGIAVNDQSDKISVLVAPFYQAPSDSVLPTPQTWPDCVLLAGLGGIALLVLLLIIFLIVNRIRRRRRLKRLAAEAAAEAVAVPPPVAEAAPPPQEGADIMEMETEKSMELRRDVRKFAEENPEIAAQMVKNWLKEGDEPG